MTTGNRSSVAGAYDHGTVTPGIALAPRADAKWLRRAVEAGGGAVVAPEDATGLVWTGFGDAGGLRDVLAAAPEVEWVQLPSAGIDHFLDVVDDRHTWTCAKGAYSEPVAEHALALALAGMRRLAERARATSWGPMGGRTLYDGRATVLGGSGGIGSALIALLAPLRVDVTVVRRRPEPVPGVARTVGPGELHEALAGADVVFNALALTPETEGIIAAPALRAMEDHAWLVNVGRGGHVVTDDLVRALAEGWIGGAALDVTDPEPLPDGHPLWDLPNCLITPHTANTFEMSLAALGLRITENVRRLGAGEPLLGVVDPTLGY